jgi:drug/metabolite transporter (DMT)-like permease
MARAQLHRLRPNGVGLVCAFTAAVCYAGLNAAIRFADVHMSIWHIIFYRSLFGAVAMALLARTAGIGILGRPRSTLCLVGLFGAAGVMALTVALIVLPLFEALVLLYLFPTFSALLSPWLTADRIAPRDWILIGTAFLGACLVLWSGSFISGLTWGHALGLMAALCLGLTFTLTRRISAGNSPLTPFFYICAAGMVASVGPLWLQSHTFAVATAGWPALGAVAALATAAHLAGNKALSYLPSPQVGVILMTEVAFGAVIGMLLFGEYLGGRTWMGGILIVASGIGLNLRGAQASADP